MRGATEAIRKSLNPSSNGIERMSASQEYVKRRSNKDLFNRTKKEQQRVAREDSTGSSKHQQNPRLLTTGELFLCITLTLCIIKAVEYTAD